MLFIVGAASKSLRAAAILCCRNPLQRSYFGCLKLPLFSETCNITCQATHMAELRNTSEVSDTAGSGVGNASAGLAAGSEVGNGSTELGDCVEITEGRAKILFPSSNEVFYNPVQEFNRDLSIAVIKYYSEHLWSPDRFRKIKRPTLRSEPTVSKPASSTSTHAHSPRATSPDSANQTGEDTGERNPPASGGRTVGETTASHCETPAAVDPAGTGPEAEPRGQAEVDWEGGGTAVAMEVEASEREGSLDPDGVCEREGEEQLAVDPSAAANWKQPDIPGLQILEALAASGLRSIRYALEVSRAHSVLANDFSPEAFRSMTRNIRHNGVQDKVKPSCREASMLMYEHREPYPNRFDVIDLDPYGSPSQFLDSTVQAVVDGGLLCVTCTDTSVLCGNHSETCHSKYGSMSIKAKYCHEMALRIVLSSLESRANCYHRYILPLLSCSVDFYLRVFVRVFTSPAEVKRSPSKLAMVYHCMGCESFHLQPIGRRLEEGKSKRYPSATGPPVGKQCEQCGGVFKLGGPIWTDPIHDSEFVRGLLESVRASPELYHTAGRINGLLTVVSEELHDVPLYHVLDQLCSTLHCTSPKMLALRSAIMGQGYRVSISHASANAIKTDAPHRVLWDIMRCWVKQNPVKNIKADSPAAAILSKEPEIAASFAIRQDANPPSRLLKLARFPENPQANWGPKARARKRGEGVEELPAKRHRLQGKRKRTDEEDSK